MPTCVYLDPHAPIAASQASGDNATFARDVLRLLLKHAGEGATNEISLAAMLVKDNSGSRRMVGRPVRGGWVTPYPVTREILIESAILRRKIRRKLPDAIHFAAVVGAWRRFVSSYDKDMKRLPANLTWLTPGSGGSSTLQSALA